MIPFLDATSLVSFLYVSDREEALRFYLDVLGLEPFRSDDFGDFLKHGDTLIRLTALPDHRPFPHPVLGWNVTDIEAAGRILLERGVLFTIYEGMNQDELGIWTAPDGKAKIAWFLDPDENVLSISQI